MDPKADITEDKEYQKFVESMVPYCHCSTHNRPCDGVLAGGLCDGIVDETDELFPRDDDDDAEAMADGVDRFGNLMP